MGRDAKYAAKTSTSDSALFSPMFSRASIGSLSLNKSSVCMEYVEKVVNAPRNPAAKSNLTVDGIGDNSEIPKSRPISIEPTAFTHRVPHGKLAGPVLAIHAETPWRAAAPNAPPVAMQRSLIIVWHPLSGGGLVWTCRHVIARDQDWLLSHSTNLARPVWMCVPGL